MPLLRETGGGGNDKNNNNNNNSFQTGNNKHAIVPLHPQTHWLFL